MPLNGTLYLIATPIGNLEDISLRALRLLREARLIAAENMRRTRLLLDHYGITTPLISYREANRATSINKILSYLEDASVALVSDAGMPAIADPGAELVAAVVKRGGRVTVAPGANAALAALVSSGLPPAPFTFVGFLSRQRGDRLRQLERLAGRPETLVLYEAPHRIEETLADMETMWGDRVATLCRELTKVHEEVLRSSLSQLRQHFSMTPPRGEITLVVAGLEPGSTDIPEQEIDRRLNAAIASGEDMRAIVAALAAETGWSRRVIYGRWQALRQQ